MSSPSPMDQFCVGTLVASKYVLTSAQCVHDKSHESLHFMIGENYLGDTGESSTHEIVLHVKNITIHEFYHPGSNNHDMAMLELVENVNLGVYTPVCLASDTDSWMGSGTPALLPSWNRTSLHLFEMATVPNIECSDASPETTVTSAMICSEPVAKLCEVIN